MSGPTTSQYRRVIMGLCHGAADAETMCTAAELAQLLGLNLRYLFIEDEAVLALAELPFAREIRLHTHSWSPLTAEAVEADIRRAATQCRRLMDEIIRDIGVPSELEVLRGDPATCIAAVCQAGDIIAIAEQGAAATHSLTRLHAGAHEAATSILLMPARLKARHGAIVALLTDGWDLALEMACRLAIAAKEDLVIMVTEHPGDDATKKAEVSAKNRAQAIGQPQARIRTHTIHGVRIDDTSHALVGVRERLIVMNRIAPPAAEASRIAAARGVPVLLVGGEPVLGRAPTIVLGFRRSEDRISAGASRAMTCGMRHCILRRPSNQLVLTPPRFVAWIATNAAPSVVTSPRYASSGAIRRASAVHGGKKIEPRIEPTERPACSIRATSSVAVRNLAVLHWFAPNHPRMRRRAAHRLHLPRSPIKSRPPGRSTRAISRTAMSASLTKVSTAMHITISKVLLVNGKA